ncbi:hypothetical protein N0V84_006983 [Fusarium piperis]|uniref:Uncharacterized protein n=1 Tax=Fusarium piperis TaxID=1435070 RepID=A0A9W9BM87_9HYPO|nr:hypothetical protein N0V84_006983 [Fusarium piperis]
MSDALTAETRAAEDDAFVAEALGRSDQQWLPAQMQDDNAFALANAWRDCDNVLSRFARGDPITSDFLDFRLGAWTQQGRCTQLSRRHCEIRRTAYAAFQKAYEAGPGPLSQTSVDEFEDQQRYEMAQER